MELNDHNYYSYPAVSASGLNTFAEGPEEYWRSSPFNNQRIPDAGDTDEMLLGRMAHMLVLENSQKFLNNFAVALPGTRRGTKAWEASLQQAGERKLVKDEQYQEAKILAEALLRNPTARMLMQQHTTEEPLLWEKQGLKCKGKMDIYREGIIIDYKTTRHNTKKKYFRGVMDLGGHRAASWYMDGVEKVKGERPIGFAHICQNKDYPDQIGFPVFTEEMLLTGSGENEFLFGQLREKLLVTGDWKEWPEGFINMEMPQFYRAIGEHA